MVPPICPGGHGELTAFGDTLRCQTCGWEPRREGKAAGSGTGWMTPAGLVALAVGLLGFAARFAAAEGLHWDERVLAGLVSPLFFFGVPVAGYLLVLGRAHRLRRPDEWGLAPVATISWVYVGLWCGLITLTDLGLTGPHGSVLGLFYGMFLLYSSVLVVPACAILGWRLTSRQRVERWKVLAAVLLPNCLCALAFLLVMFL